MKHGGHGDYRGGLPHAVPHGILRFVAVAVYFRQRPVIPNGSTQHNRNSFFYCGVNDSVIDVVFLDKFRNGTGLPHFVNQFQMVVVTVRCVLLGVDVLTQRRIHVSTLQIVGRQRVSGQHRIRISRVDQRGKGFAGLQVEGKCRSQHPDHVTVLLFVLQQLHDFIHVLGESRLSGASGSECEGVAGFVFLIESIGVHKNTFFAVLGAAADDPVSRLQSARFHCLNLLTVKHRNGVHPALFHHEPFSVNLEILRENTQRMEIIRCDAVPRRLDQSRVGSVYEFLFGKIGMCILS